MSGASHTTRVLGAVCLAIAVLASAACGPATASADPPLYGVTLDKVTHLERLLGELAALPERPTTRIYFERRAPASSYEQDVREIHTVSAVMGELLDSSDEKAESVSEFQSRTLSYLSTLSGDVDIWEIGNEVNGNWTGPYEAVAAKLSEAYEDVAATGAATALTLYANNFGPEHCGDGSSELTPVQFSERHVPARVADGLDYVLLSYYPTECGGREPDATEVAQELERLHALYPSAALGFGEVGLPRPAGRRTLATAKQLMRWAYSLDPGLPYYVGGYFWWYGAEDVLRPHARLREALPEAFQLEAGALGGG